MNRGKTGVGGARRSVGVRGAQRPVISIVASLLAAGTAFGLARAAHPAIASLPPPSPPPAAADSIEEFAPHFDPSDWDSVTAAYDASVRRNRERRLIPRYGLRFDKAEGFHLEAGGSLTDRQLHIRDLDLRAGYDFGRRRPVGALRVRMDLDRRSRWGVDAEAAELVRPFGNHQPYGNTWLTLLGGYDAMQYQLERRLGISVTRRFAEDRRVSIGYVRFEQDLLRPVTDFRFLGGDAWMDRNEAAEPFTGNGLRLHLRRGPSYEEETVVQGLLTETELLVFGGTMLGGAREFSRLQADAWYTKALPRSAAVHLKGSASLATGDAPRQAWPDLGGAAGLRAIPPRGAGTGDSLVGTSRLLLRAEYRSSTAALRSGNLKILRNLGLKLVPFAEAGAVWGLERGGNEPRIRQIHEWKDLRAPRGSETHWDLGAGLRRDIDYTGMISYIEIDIAWPMGADNGPPRIMVQFSRDGLD
jgi:hypothetical protein